MQEGSKGENDIKSTLDHIGTKYPFEWNPTVTPSRRFRMRKGIASTQTVRANGPRDKSVAQFFL
jgi:hypothetical protein